MKYNLDLLKYIWDNRHLRGEQSPQYLFNICIEPMKKGDWNRYTIWLNDHGELHNISGVVYGVVSDFHLKDDIKLWMDTQYHCRPIKIEVTGFVVYLLHQFYQGIAQILLEQGMITETESVEKSYTFTAANSFQRLL